MSDLLENTADISTTIDTDIDGVRSGGGKPAIEPTPQKLNTPSKPLRLELVEHDRNAKLWATGTLRLDVALIAKNPRKRCCVINNILDLTAAPSNGGGEQLSILTVCGNWHSG